MIDDMPKRTAPTPPAPALLGDAAGALEIVVLLLLDVVAVHAPTLAAPLLHELDTLLSGRLPTPGLQARLREIRDHLAQIARGSGLPN